MNIGQMQQLNTTKLIRIVEYIQDRPNGISVPVTSELLHIGHNL